MADKKPHLSLLPDNIVTFLTFIDILFATLIAYIITEVYLENIFTYSWRNIIIFSLLYLPNIIKMLMHWWSLHFDLTLIQSFMKNEHMSLIYYVGGLIISGWYVAFSKLILLWFLDGDYDYIKIAFISMAFIRIPDILHCIIFWPLEIKRKINNHIAGSKIILTWYKEKYPKYFFAYIVNIILGISTLFVSSKYLLYIAIIFFIAEACVEIPIYLGRKIFYLEIRKYIE